MSRHTKIAAAVAGIAAVGLALAGCSGGSSSADNAALTTKNASGTVSYWLWDNNQQPAYQACADAFHQANPKIDVKISQYAWGDYWTKLTTGFASGTAPDVFTDHISQYPQFVKDKQLVPLDTIVKDDKIDLTQYQPGLADLWVAKDGHRYGLPKDFDTTAYFYNKNMADAAGVTPAQLGSLTWNPNDGGTLEKVAAHLSVDQNGKRGDEAGFDAAHVKVYGLGLDGGSGGYVGQTQWSPYALSLGAWKYMNKDTWGTQFNYNDADFQKMITWFSGMIKKGYMPSIAAITNQDSVSLLAAGKYGMLLQGDWVTSSASSQMGAKPGLAPTPVGPSGKRASMFNGLGDSIWVGSKNKPAAAKWVEYLASPACQDIIASKAIVFPAIKEATDKAQAAFTAKGLDMSAFLVHIKDGTTALYPLSENSAKITTIMQPAMDSVFSYKSPASSLTSANTQVNALFQQ